MSIKEIGSEFWNVPSCKEKNDNFPLYTDWYLSGTSALYAIILDIKQTRQVHSIALPSWCCECMIEPFLKNNIRVLFYTVCPDNKSGVSFIFPDLSQCDILFVMDYFGYRREYTYPEFDGIIIRDLTHSVFCGSYHDADYYFGSLRKWAGFWTGGFAWKQNGSHLPELAQSEDCEKYISLRKTAMTMKEKYICGFNSNKCYLSIYEEAEELLDHGCCGTADPRDVELAPYLAVNEMAARRRENAEEILDAFSQYALFPSLNELDCPMFVPILLPEICRNSIRKYLIEHSIYCPIHWPLSPLHRFNERGAALYRNELSLICDQRYSKESIHKEIKVLSMALKRNML